jgi:prepilin-type N-terminal cleavage/methylation domain-containing protein
MTLSRTNIASRQLHSRFACALPASSADPQAPRQRGFTLIELLIVVAIIALLVAVVLPSMSRARLLAQRAHCQSSLRSLGLAASMYQTEFDQYVPVAHANIGPQSKNPWPSWRKSLLPYAGSFEAFNCASATGEREFFTSESQITDTVQSECGNSGSFGIIYDWALAGYDTVTYTGSIGRGHPSHSQAFSTKPNTAWRDPAHSIYLADAVLSKTPIGTHPIKRHKEFGTSIIHAPDAADSLTTGVIRRFSDRHITANCLMVDGRVASYAPAELESMRRGSPGCLWDKE